jgi:DNA-binding transcriptional MerR regulator
MPTLDQLGISESDWNQMPASGRVTIMFLLKQNQLLENRTYTFHLEVERLKIELERLKKLELEIAELRERLGQNSQNSGSLGIAVRCPKILWSSTNNHHRGQPNASSDRAVVESSRHSSPERRDY